MDTALDRAPRDSRGSLQDQVLGPTVEHDPEHPENSEGGSTIVCLGI